MIYWLDKSNRYILSDASQEYITNAMEVENNTYNTKQMAIVTKTKWFKVRI